MAVYVTVGSVFKSFYFTILFISVLGHMGFKLLLQQAAELRRTHFARPPPKPDPDPTTSSAQSKPLSKSQRRRRRRQLRIAQRPYLDQLLVDCDSHRLECKRRGKDGRTSPWVIWKKRLNLWEWFWHTVDSISNQPLDDSPILDHSCTYSRPQYFDDCNVPSWRLLAFPLGFLIDSIKISLVWTLVWTSLLLDASVIDGVRQVWVCMVVMMYNLWLGYAYLPRFSRCFKMLTLVPRRIVLFIARDIPSLWYDLDGELESLRTDVEAILDGDIEQTSWDWMDLVKNAVQYGLDALTSHHLPRHDVSSLDPFSDAGTSSLRPNWRLRRHIRRVCDKFDRRATQTALAEMNRGSPVPVDSEAEVEDMSHNKVFDKVTRTLQSLTDRFVESFNPGTAGMDLLYVERYEHRRAPKERDSVSVDLRKCLKLMMMKYLVNVAAICGTDEEVVLNMVGAPTLPLIIDTGASCCVSPCRDDFVPGTYRPSKMKIKDLSSMNKVAGKGMIKWHVLDRQGNTHCIELEGYHIPHASVRLLSPQCLFQKVGGTGSQDEFKYILHLTNLNITLDAPYGHANLPVLTLATDDMLSSIKDTWMEAFQVDIDEKDIWGQSILNERNQNLSAAEKELLLWHQKLSHAGLSQIQRLCSRQRQKKISTVDEFIAFRDSHNLPCKYNVSQAGTSSLLCAACCISKATRRKPTVRSAGKQMQEMKLKENDLQPGDRISCDHYVSPVPGRVVSTSGHSSTTHGYVAGTIYVDHASGWIFHRAQKSISASDTIRGKLLLEREAVEVGTKIKAYHSDNGVFNSEEFRKHCDQLDQTQTFSGVGAKFQNGVAERSILTVCSMARASMLHAALHWPGMKFLTFWPMAMTYAIWIYNQLPQRSSGLSPEELWCRNKSSRTNLKRAHVFGCPVYVLHPKLQDGQSIPKWNAKARQGVFVGYSTEHSSTVALVYNPSTQHISPQYHVIFDDAFATVPSLASEVERNETFAKLYETEAREYYIDAADVDAGRITPCDNWDWDLPVPKTPEGADATERNDVSEGDEVTEGADDSEGAKGDSEGAVGDNSIGVAPESVSDEVVEVELEVRETDDSESHKSDSPLHQNEQRPQSSSSSTSPPRYNLRRRVVTALLTIPQYTLTAASSWYQPPASVANVGTRYASKEKTVKRAYLNELALLSEDWDTLNEDICQGVGEFVAYLKPDLSDCLGANTVTDVQPHILKAKATKNDADSPSFRQAMNSHNADKWSEACEIELETLRKINAWTLVKREDWMRVLPMTWAFKLKRFPDGLPKKFKARFCVRGDRQKEGIDYFETWAPVVQWTTVRAMLILAAKQGLCTAQADITAAFVHAPLKEDEIIFVEQPKGWSYGDDYVLQLDRSVYGIKQAPRNFFHFLTDEFHKLNMKPSEHDPCLFVGDTVTAIVYVDDILLFSKDDKEITRVISALQAQGVQIRREGSAEGFLGVAVDRVSDGIFNKIQMTQTGLTKRIVEALGLCSQYSTSISTPAEAAPLPKDTGGAPATENFNYAAVVGMLLYLSGHTRPDIAFAVHQCARYTFCPTRRHEKALIRIGRYLKGTMNRGMTMTPTAEPRVDCYPDADFAGLYGHEDSQDPHCARSRTGFVILAFGCPILWKSSMQNIIALSTMEAEYVALSTACRDLFPVVELIRELCIVSGLDANFKSKIHIKIHEDNVGALRLGKLEPRRMTPRSKHYAIKYHWFREHVADPSKRIELTKIDTANQLGDIFTKGLTRASFEHLRCSLMGW